MRRVALWHVHTFDLRREMDETVRDHILGKESVSGDGERI